MFDKFANNVWKEQMILKFELNKGGDQSGKAQSILLSAIDEQTARLRVATVDGPGEEEKVTERIIDVQPLVDIKEIFLKHEMYRWTNRAFTFAFSIDRPTICYTFTFERGTVQFSSQSFPNPYAGKIAEIDDILNSIISE